MVMSGCILILAFGSIAWQNISLGRIIAMLVILLCSRYGSVTGGAISGISTGAIFSIASRENGYICGGFAFGGLMAGGVFLFWEKGGGGWSCILKKWWCVLVGVGCGGHTGGCYV